MNFHVNSSFYFSFNFFFNIKRPKTEESHPVQKPSQLAKTGQLWGNCAPTILKFRISAPPLPLNAMFLGADIHLYDGGREQRLRFFMSLWLAYKWFSCIKMKCIWPIGSIHSVTVSKNFHNFSYLKGLKSSTENNWRLYPFSFPLVCSFAVWMASEPVSFSMASLKATLGSAVYRNPSQDKGPSSLLSSLMGSLELWSLKAVTKKLGTQMSSGSYTNHLLVPSGPGVGQILHSQWTLNLIPMHSVLWLLPFRPLGRFLPPQPSLLTYKYKLLSTARRFQESPASICGDLHLRQSPDFQPVGSRPQSHRWDVHLCMFLLSDRYPADFWSYASHWPRGKRHQNFEGAVRLTWPVQRTREGMFRTLLKRKF